MNKLFSLIFTIFLILSSCDNPFAKNEEQETQQSLDDTLPIKQLYCSQITDELYASHRCDKITFKALQVAFCNNGSIDGHYDDGKWYRWDLDTDEPCFKDGQDLGSKSPCSGDGLIAATHAWLTQGNQPQAARTVQYLEDNDWICGEGYTGFTKCGKLKWLLRSVRDYLEGDDIHAPAYVSAAIAASGLVDLSDLLKEFNKYLVALHAYAFGRMNHVFSDQTMKILRDLVDSSPDSMIFQALYHRYLDGDQQKALEIIKRECPADAMPTDVNYANWGSSPRAIHCIVAISILQGV